MSGDGHKSWKRKGFSETTMLTRVAPGRPTLAISELTFPMSVLAIAVAAPALSSPIDTSTFEPVHLTPTFVSESKSCASRVKSLGDIGEPKVKRTRNGRSRNFPVTDEASPPNERPSPAGQVHEPSGQCVTASTVQSLQAVLLIKG